MSEKFGASMEEAKILMLKAKQLGLVPYGISFNVGSQARSKLAWARGIKDVAHLMASLSKKGIKVKVINLGGGFPYSYQPGDIYCSIDKISTSILPALKRLPYKVDYIVEPGRAIVANAYGLIASVIGECKRANGHWLYLDAGVYNALFEAMIHQGSTKYRVKCLSNSHSSKIKKKYFILTGPTCDNIDVINRKVLLPSYMQIGDRVIVFDVGAYTHSLSTCFNGFPKPKTIITNE